MTEPRKVKKLDSAQMEERVKEIKDIAKRVYCISFNYHLTHAVFGSDGFLLQSRKEKYNAELKDLNEKLQVAIREKNTVEEDTLKAKADQLLKDLKKRKYRILIDYVDMDDPDGGRVISIEDNLLIQLPLKHTLNIKDKSTGELQTEAVKKVRNIMAHELGHIILHNNLLSEFKLQGSEHPDLKSVDWEAKVFATELLRLYRKKDHRINWEE